MTDKDEDKGKPIEENFIPNPCDESEDSGPMILVFTGVKDLIGSFGGINEDTRSIILELPLIYREFIAGQPSTSNTPPPIGSAMMPVYAPLKAIKWIEVYPQTLYFFDRRRGEDQGLVTSYRDALNQFLSSSVVVPTNAEVRKLTIAPK